MIENMCRGSLKKEKIQRNKNYLGIINAYKYPILHYKVLYRDTLLDQFD